MMMETRQRKLRIGPLPGGDRRGTSVAGHGRDSMLASDSLLDGWAGVGDADSRGASSRTTAESRSSRSSSRAVTPAEDVSQEACVTQPATTKAGKTRVRMKWDDDINLFIMRTYLEVTKLETDRTMYCKKLYDKFKIKYPHLNVSAQRVADQRRVIIRNKLLPDNVIENLKKEISEQLNHDENPQILISHTPTRPVPQFEGPIVQNIPSTLSLTNEILSTFTSDASTQTPSLLNTHTTITQNLDQPRTDIFTSRLTHQLETALTLYTGTNPTTRPKLPKLKENKKLYQLLDIFNKEILGKFYSIDTDVNEIHTLIYCSALVISENLGYKVKEDPPTRNYSTNSGIPAWQIRIEKDIKSLRSDIGRLTQYMNNNRSKKVLKHVDKIFKTTKVHTSHEKDNMRPEEYLDTLKQKLTLKSQRLARYKKALQRKNDNKLFANNEKQFYRTLRKDDNSKNFDLPNPDDLKNYWTDLWKKRKDHNDNADWIKDEESRWNHIEEMEFTEITGEDIKIITQKTKNWKAAGIDGVHNFWYKKFFILHDVLARIISDLLKGTSEMPSFLTTGITYMLPKNNDTTNPAQYRPITCLPTIYKIITSCITHKINIHLSQHNIISEEQKGCRRNHRGCKEQLIIDSTILKHAQTHNRNIHISYIDYKKAFDSVPHSWLIRVLQIHKINPTIITFLENAMVEWKTKLVVSNSVQSITTEEVPIDNGIFQGDTFSPVWFCLALNPLSRLLNNDKSGYRLTTETEISHLMYMDDIKLFAKTDKALSKLLQTTTKFSTDINMSFGLDKCRTLHIHKGKILSNKDNDNTHNTETNFTEMNEVDAYKYLGILQSKAINHTQIKKKLSNEYIRRLNLICKKSLLSKHLFKAINTFAIPVLTYSFGVIKWSQTDINQLEIKTRTTLTKHNNLHPKSAIERISVKRLKGGRGLIDLKVLWEGQINNLRKFFYDKAETSNIHLATVESDKNFTPLNLKTRDIPTTLPKTAETDKINSWRRKELHGRHLHDLEQVHIDLEASNKWLKLGSLFPETEGFMIAIQDQVINTKNYRKYIIKDPNTPNDNCRKCHRQPETIQHITSACPTLTQTDYTHRHNQIAHIIHQKLAINHKLIPCKPTPYYQYTPKPVLEDTNHKLYFDRAILTDKTIHYNRPDITLIDKQNKIVFLIDIAVPNTHNLHKTITEKINKYTELKEEIIRIWKMNKVYIVPLVLSSTGVIPKHLLQALKTIDIPEHTYMTMQKAAILNTCRIVRKFLQDDINKLPTTEHETHLA